MKFTQRRLILNTAPITIPDAVIQVGRQRFVDSDQLRGLRESYRDTHIFKRRDEFILDMPVSDDACPLGEVQSLRLKDDFGISKALILDAYLRYLHKRGYEIIGYVPLDLLSRDDLLRSSVPDGIPYPGWLSVRLRYEIDVRRHQLDDKQVIPILALGLRTAIVIDGSCTDLMGYGVDLTGKYVLKTLDGNSAPLRPHRRLMGKVLGIAGQTLLLGDTRDDETSVEASRVFLEPRRENLLACLQAIFGEQGNRIWQRLYTKMSNANDGEAKLKKIREVLSFFSKQNLELAPRVEFRVGEQEVESLDRLFPQINHEKSPIYVFGPSQKTDTWHNRGLEKFGPYDQSTFTPSTPKIVVICQSRCRGQTELFLRRLLDGIHGITDGRGREPFGKGFVRLYCLDKCQPEFFEAPNESADAYRTAVGRAVESAADRKFQWNLAMVQIQENFHGLTGDSNPYLVSKAAFLLHGIPSQEVELETMEQPDQQIVYTLNNFALACYAKLGGVPWLIQANRGIAHELVFGLGSASMGEGRLGARERVVGITTVFTGDGNYILENRSRSASMDEYPTVLLESLKASVATVRQIFNWQNRDSVRLVFHAFKPFRTEQIDAVRVVVSDLADYDVQYAFVHVIDNHPYALFDEANSGGVWDAQAKAKKGRYAPQRGLWLQLSHFESLLVLTGAREVKRPEDGLPTPILLRLDRNSTFQDMKYLTRQAYHFACHSWRSFFPSPMPITILYSELIASLLGNLSQMSKWDSQAMLGPVGRTRWFL